MAYGKPILSSLKYLPHFEFIRLEDELKGERMVTPGIQTCPRIVHIDKGSNVE